MKLTRLLFGLIIATMLSSSIFLAFAAGDINVQLQIPIGSFDKVPACKEVQTGTDPVTHRPIMGLTCTGLSDYIVTIYEWLVRAAAILAAAMITWGGFQWLSAAGESKRVEEGKKTMHNALIGLVLALGSYTLLWAINPDLVGVGKLDLSLIAAKQVLISPPDGVCCYAVTQLLGVGGGTPVSSKIKYASGVSLDKCKEETKPGLGSGSVPRTVDVAFYCSKQGVPATVSNDDLCWKIVSDPSNTETSIHCTAKTAIP